MDVAAVDGDPRGFMASGISRTSSIFSSPLSNEAVLDLDVVGQV